MTRIVQSGPWQGHAIRRARKQGRCDYCNPERLGIGSGQCPNMIKVGDLYVEGEMDPYRAGGFGRERYCLECVNTPSDHEDERAATINNDTATEALTALKALMDYTGGWDQPATHPCGQAAAVLRKYGMAP